MLFRPHFLGIITVIAVVSFCGYSLSAQGMTDSVAGNFAAWKEPQNAHSIPDWVRRMLVRDFRGLTGIERQKRLEVYFVELKNIVSDADVVASTRYNAILAIGQLTSEESKTDNLPTAYPTVLPYLVDVYQDTDFPAYLKYGALLGIVRHAHCGINAAMYDKVIELFLQTILSEQGENTRVADSISDLTVPLEPAVWDWYRQTTLEGLSALKMTGTNCNVVAELLSVINQRTQKLETFCQRQDSVNIEEWKQIQRDIDWVSKVAKTLGDLDYRSAIKVDAQAMTEAFIRLTKAVCNVEIKRAIEIIDQKNTNQNSPILMEQIVVDMKMCIQNIVWGIRSRFLTGKPAEHSFYTSLANDEQMIKRLDNFLKALNDISAFLDEGNIANRHTTAAAETGGGFKFDLSELRDMLITFSKTLE